ncbi:MAG TPA: PilT/PilU family type 4a pilus ATPase [Armatimonadota bacterium]|nr:PilT/PilU family type 4a pilus ATPase [Armatimonadota bacterium]
MSDTGVASNPLLAKLLERQGLLPPDVLEGLLQKARTLQEWLGEVAVDDKLLTFREIAQAIAREMKLPLVDLRPMSPPDARVLERLPAETCRNHGLVPVAFEGDSLHIVVSNPLDEGGMLVIRTLVNCTIAVRVAPLDDIRTTIERWYGFADAAAPYLLKTAPTPPPAPPPGPPRSSVFAPAAMANNAEELALDQLLLQMMENRSSDLHLAVGSSPMMRVDGELRPMPFPTMTPRAIQTMCYALLTDVQITQFERHWELDFAYSLPGVSRFRVNYHRQRGSMGAVFRTIPMEIPTLDKLAMSPMIREFTQRPRGLVLVTGPTGSGKSTTLAAMVEEINRTQRTHIVTIEDPVEFLFNNKLSIVTQREVGADTESFGTALRHVLRQDPDVILIGEMRDLETIATAVSAAETGHLVFATLHTTSAAQTVERIIDVFPPHQHEQIRSQLANVLEGIICQTLLPNLDGRGRSCAQEILVCTAAVRTLIRDSKAHQITSVIQASAKYGMQTLDQALKTLVLQRKVSLEEAIKKASNPEDFKALVAMQ